MTEKCPYCGEDMISGRLCANQSASLEFNGDAPHFPEDFFIAGPSCPVADCYWYS